MSSSTADPDRCHREDPRRARSRDKVLAATVALLRELGLHGLTIEAVAARAGVAKTTIYRQFPDRDSLHAAALDAVRPVQRPPRTDDLIDDLVAACVGLNDALWTTDFGPLVLTAIDAAERSPAMAAQLQAISGARRAALVERLVEAQDAGRLEPDVDLDLLGARLVGPLFYRRFLTRQATDREFVVRLVTSTVEPLVGR